MTPVCQVLMVLKQIADDSYTVDFPNFVKEVEPLHVFTFWKSCHIYSTHERAASALKLQVPCRDHFTGTDKWHGSWQVHVMRHHLY
jgi:hypothetical protein